MMKVRGEAGDRDAGGGEAGERCTWEGGTEE